MLTQGGLCTLVSGARDSWSVLSGVSSARLAKRLEGCDKAVVVAEVLLNSNPAEDAGSL